MFEETSRYKTYLLTIWEERRADLEMAPFWRFSLEDTRNGKRRGYPTLEALFQALRNEIEGTQSSLNDGMDG